MLYKLHNKICCESCLLRSCRVAPPIILYINRNNLAYPLYDSLKYARSQCQHSEALSLSDMINNHFCSISRIPHVNNSHKFYLPPSPYLGWPYKTAGHRDSGWRFGLASLLAQLVLCDSGPELRSPSFCFFFLLRFSCSSHNLSTRLLRASSRITAQRCCTVSNCHCGTFAWEAKTISTDEHIVGWHYYSSANCELLTVVKR